MADLRGISARRLAPFVVILTLILSGPAFAGWDYWDEHPSAQASLSLKPVRETVLNIGNQGPEGLGQSLELAFKRFERRGAQPVILLPGIASNDRVWDSMIAELSFARYLHAEGFDVWVANYRHLGTEGFQSESPGLPYHWTVDDLAIYDLPALVEKVRASTGRRPFVAGHSLSGWILEGYLAGIRYDVDGQVVPDRALAKVRQKGLKGVITLAGVYSSWWPKSLKNALFDPVMSLNDYYQSNYELEALAHSPILYEVGYRIPSAPLSWVADLLTLPLEKLPIVGSTLAKAYKKFQNAVIESPALAMFYYSPNTDTDLVSHHGLDGLEEFGPRVLEQLGNAVVHRSTTSFYHGARPTRLYSYSSVRKSIDVPLLFVAGSKDRLANAEMIYRDGYLAYQAKDKTFILSEAGHLDVISGNNADRVVLEPLVRWMNHRR